MIKQVNIAVSCEDGTVTDLAFITMNRGNVLPYGATWVNQEAGIWEREPTHENIFAEISKSKAFTEGSPPTGYRLFTEEENRADRTYRNAWVDNGGKLETDLAKARELHLAHVRAARDPKFLELDKKQWPLIGPMFAGDKAASDKFQELEAEKQKLRDLPATLHVEAARSVDDLKAKWPRELEEA